MALMWYSRLGQAVYLQRDTAVTSEPSSGFSKAADGNVVDVENAARDEDASDTTQGLSEDISEIGKGKTDDSAMSDEPLSRIVSFLKDRMPDVKLKVFKVLFQFVAGDTSLHAGLCNSFGLMTGKFMNGC